MAAAVKGKQTKSSGQVVYPILWRLSLLPSLSFLWTASGTQVEMWCVTNTWMKVFALAAYPAGGTAADLWAVHSEIPL